jgi:hypothetical protein
MKVPESLAEIVRARSESGIGLPHSKTSRNEWRAVRRDSVLECGSPMPLWVRFVDWCKFGDQNPPPHVGAYNPV